MPLDRARIWESIITGLVIAAAVRFLFPLLTGEDD